MVNEYSRDPHTRPTLVAHLQDAANRYEDRPNRPSIDTLLRERATRPSKDAWLDKKAEFVATYDGDGNPIIALKSTSPLTNITLSEVFPLSERAREIQDTSAPLDFDAPSGFLAGVKSKSETLPTKEIFLPIVTGQGDTIAPAAIDTWRYFATSTNSNRGISRTRQIGPRGF